MSPEDRKVNLFITNKEQFSGQTSWLGKKLEVDLGRNESLQGVTVCLQFKVINSVRVTKAWVSEFLDSSESIKRRNLPTVSVQTHAAVC